MSDGKDIGARFGFFCRPRLMTSGPNHGKIVKNFRGVLSEAEADKVIFYHDLFVEELTSLGVDVPPTEMQKVSHGKTFRVQVVQDPIEAEFHSRHLLQVAEPDICVRMLEGLMLDAVRVIEHNQNLTGDQKELGFHPTFRNYFYKDDRFLMIDTFPPMSGGRETVEEIVQIQLKLRWLGKLARPILNLVTDEYYDPPRMMLGIVATATRLRPELSERFFEKTREMVDKHVTGQAREMLDRETRQLTAAPKQHPLVRAFKKQ